MQRRGWRDDDERCFQMKLWACCLSSKLRQHHSEGQRRTVKQSYTYLFWLPSFSFHQELKIHKNLPQSLLQQQTLSNCDHPCCLRLCHVSLILHRGLSELWRDRTGMESNKNKDGGWKWQRKGRRKIIWKTFRSSKCDGNTEDEARKAHEGPCKL